MNYVDVAMTAAEAGAAAIAQCSKHFTQKSSAFDFQAEADLASEKAILKVIQEHCPTHGILAEESGEQGEQSEYLWIIDPVDGTTNFLHDSDEYCISVALWQNGEPVVGVLLQPALNRLYAAERGKGARLNGEELHVSKRTKLNELCVGTNASANAQAETFGVLQKLVAHLGHIRITGSSALHLANVARGVFDCNFKVRFNAWDFAAGILLVQEAGGEVTDLNGEKITIHSENILASNGQRHKELLQLIAAARTL